jgi:transposase InsO family protein
MFVVATATFRLVYALIVLSLDRRRVVHFEVTPNPTQNWLSRQMTEAFPWDTVPRYLLRDRDKSYGPAFRHRLRAMGITEVITAPRSPWQNPYAERLIGSIRRECLDHVIGDGAQVEGSVIAQDVTVCGRVKGTIRAVRVKLQHGGAVEGDVFHRSLSIDENSQFEGSSRRVENPADLSLSVDGKGPEKEDLQSSALAPYLQRVEESASTEWSESTVESKS